MDGVDHCMPKYSKSVAPPPRIDGYINKISSLEVFNLNHAYCLIGALSDTPNSSPTSYRLLVIKKQALSPDLQTINDPTEYPANKPGSVAATQFLLQKISDEYNDGNPLTPQSSVLTGFGLTSLIRFLDCYYLTVITRRSKVGSIGGEAVYSIKR